MRRAIVVQVQGYIPSRYTKQHVQNSNKMNDKLCELLNWIPIPPHSLASLLALSSDLSFNTNFYNNNSIHHSLNKATDFALTPTLWQRLRLTYPNVTYTYTVCWILYVLSTVVCIYQIHFLSWCVSTRYRRRTTTHSQLNVRLFVLWQRVVSSAKKKKVFILCSLLFS